MPEGEYHESLNFFCTKMLDEANYAPGQMPEKKKAKDNPAGLAGQRLTSQRLLLLNILSEGEHLAADEVYRRARDKEPCLSMSTVYRNLRLFVKLGIVEEHHFNKAHCCYEVRTKAEHHHLVCLGCGRIIDFQYLMNQEITDNIETRYGFRTTGAKVVLVGYCAGCLAGEGKVT